MSNKSGISDQVISLPQGGGALKGLGEKFQPDLHTGTGNFSVPLALPPGRNGFQPQLSLAYCTGQGQGPFGLGWGLSLPGIRRKTTKGFPRYQESQDVFILSGAEDLVPVAQETDAVQYRPRTEGLFARIRHMGTCTPNSSGAAQDYWEVTSKDGFTSYYGTPRPDPSPAGWQDPAVVADPSDPGKIFAWNLTRTQDVFGNVIEYDYDSDHGSDAFHAWSQIYPSRIRYGDYTAASGETAFLTTVTFIYEDLDGQDGRASEPFSDYRAGFEIRTRKRCTRIEIRTHADQDRLLRSYSLAYADQAANGVLLLQSIRLTGHDGARHEDMPALAFTYTAFTPGQQTFFALTGPDLPPRDLSHPDYELVDLFGRGLPDVVEMKGAVRYWRNLGRGRFDRPREMNDAPAEAWLANPGVQMMDADGDGRADLLVTRDGVCGTYALNADGAWDARSFQAYDQAPSFDLEDPEVRLVDLDGDGVTDAIRTGERLECFFQDRRAGWTWAEAQVRGPLEVFPNVYFSDPRVKLADMSGDGLQDIVLVQNGRVDYWPGLGRGRWGKRITMRRSPRFPENFDPKRLLLGDVDGDGAADLVYVDDNRVTLWINRQGNGWSEPVVIPGTPAVTDMDAVRLADMLGTGVAGVLWTRDVSALSPDRFFFLDFTGGMKPYLLSASDNNLGAVIRAEYQSSVMHFLEDEPDPATRWRTTLPFPVQVVSSTTVTEAFSGSTLTTRYHYHHGAWDGGEREFRGFGRVEQWDSERIQPAGSTVAAAHYSPPVWTKTWFYQGPLGPEFGEWSEPDWHREFWQGDAPLLTPPAALSVLLAGLTRRAARDALRTLRGSILRTELYACDGSSRQDRPYAVAEKTYGVREEGRALPGIDGDPRVYFPFLAGERSTQWERGDDPMTQVQITDDHDAFGNPGRTTTVWLPRRRSARKSWTAAAVGTVAVDEDRVLSLHTRTAYAQPDSGVYIHDRPAQVLSVEQTTETRLADPADMELATFMRTCLKAVWDQHGAFVSAFAGWSAGTPLPAAVRAVSHVLYHYDGPAYQGRPVGALGPYGVPVRAEALAFTASELNAGYGARRPDYLGGADALPAGAPAGFGVAAGYTLMPDSGEGYLAGYYLQSQRQQYDFQSLGTVPARGLVVGRQDPLGRLYQVQYDDYAFLPLKVTDPAGLELQAQYDYRLFQPRTVTDPNGQATCTVYTPLGLVRAQYLQGREGEGGTPEKPEKTYDYDFAAYERTRCDAQPQPMHVHARQRVWHAQDHPRDEWIETREYTDGFGRLIQKRLQAEDLVLGVSGDDTGLGLNPGEVLGAAEGNRRTDRVVVSGWQIYDNKGRVVEKYEPFFSEGWDCQGEADARQGKHIAMFYDPRGQVIRTVFPDGAMQRVIFGVPASLDTPDDFLPTPWETYTYDPNDLASVSRDPQTQQLLTDHAPVGHHFTPGQALLNSRGMVIAQLARNGGHASEEWYLTRMSYDVRKNVLSVTDPLGRRAFTHAYDLLNRPLRTDNIDGGSRWAVLDAQGNLIDHQDGKGSRVLYEYDSLNRPAAVWARDRDGQSITLRQRLAYGDAGAPTQSPTERAEERKRNRLGRLARQYDEAGLVEYPGYDFKGNLLEKSRRVICDDAIEKGWVAAWEISTAEQALEAKAYVTNMAYDALNRIVTLTYPQDATAARARADLTYNRAGALERVLLDQAAYVEWIGYNPKGQRVLIAYGNGIMTRYAYDPATFRLLRLRSEGYTRTGDTWKGQGAVLQETTYGYDLAGNMVRLEDRTPGSGVANTPDGRDRLIRRFAYDPIYRLIESNGRACPGV